MGRHSEEEVAIVEDSLYFELTPRPFRRSKIVFYRLEDGNKVELTPKVMWNGKWRKMTQRELRLYFSLYYNN